MNRFYQYPKILQWTVTFVLLLVFLLTMVLWMKFITINPLFYFLFFFLVPIMQFSLTPLMRVLGMYKYLSPMLLVYSPNPKKYDLHNGTSFDYLFVMTQERNGRSFQNTMLIYYLEGLLKIIEELEEGVIEPSIIISGTSYFFSDSTVERFGFSIEPPTSFYKMNLYINYLDLLWMYSLAKGKLSFPNLSNIKAATTTGKRLLEKKDHLQSLHVYLQGKVAV